MPITGATTTAGNDVVSITPTGSYSIDGQGGTDTLNIDYSMLSTSLDFRYAGNGYYALTDDFFSSASFINFEIYNLKGGSGDDLLSGGAAADHLYGGAGADTITSGVGADVVDGGAGLFDRWVADYGGLTKAVTVQLAATGSYTVVATGAVVSNIEGLTINTGIGADVIDTTAVTGNDTVVTGSGNDIFRTKGGFDSFDGGSGTDRMVIDYSDATTAVSQSYIGNGWYQLGDKAGTQSVQYINTESYDLTGGSADDSLSGGAAADRLVGNAGNDLLNGGGGVDTIIGGSGIDTWQVNFSARTGATVDLMAQTTTGGGTLSGIEAINYTGGVGVDRVTANAGAYNDSFATGDGADMVSTGRGIDTADGGGGNDKLVMDWSAIADPLQGISNTYQGNGWYRYAAASGDQLDYIGFELYDLRGGAGADTLNGGALKDTLIGNGGDDTLNSGTGDAVIDGGTGNDRWIADLSAELAPVLFNAVGSQTAAQVVKAGSSVTNIEAVSLQTGLAADVIDMSGFALNDTMTTGAGNDVINPGLGFDSVDGQSDEDTLVLNYSTLGSDVSTTYIGNGWNQYGTADGATHANYINIEKFNITGGSGNDSLVGANNKDVLDGGAGNDVLNGGGGSDTITGGTGIDTWIGNYGDVTDPILFKLTNGTGSLTSAEVLTKITGIENTNVTTGANDDVINLSANIGNDHISSGGGDDIINVGRGRIEWVDGGAGTDSVTADGLSAGSGIHMFYAGNGWYEAASATGDYKLDINGIEHFTFYGSSFNDKLFGFGDSDTLSGRAGADTLQGGGGNDTLTGGAGQDIFYYENVWADGVDLITDANAVDHDIIRMAGVTLGNVTNGDGSTVLAGDVQVQTVNGVTSVFVGLDSTAGADFTVQLTGTFAASAFHASGTDLML